MQHTECKGCVHLAIGRMSVFCMEKVHQKHINGLPVPAFGVCDYYEKDFSQ